MTEEVIADLCILGAGAGGLTLAAAASQMGARVVLIERGAMGGDCLNVGCVPSKALLAAAGRAQAARSGGAFGVEAEPRIDFTRVLAHVRETIAAIAPQDSKPRFEALGVRVIEAEGRFVAPDRVHAGDFSVTARRYVIATGSRPLIPPLRGLTEIPYLTNETIFALPALPDHLLVLGGGPMGLELAQAFRRLGARVSVLEAGRALGSEDPELAVILGARLAVEGVRLIEGAEVSAVMKEGTGVRLRYRDGMGEHEITGSHLLVATGRRAALEALDLEAAGVARSENGVKVDAGLRTTNRRVYAIGDAAGGAQFTHLASHHAGIVLRRALFRLPARVGRHTVPRVVYTDPEFAAVGLGEAEARQRCGRLRILRQSFHDNDRARIERRPHGLLKAFVGPRGRILGAVILGPHAGELIQPWALALDRRLRIGALAGLLAPYPSLSEMSARAGMAYFIPTLLGRRTRGLVRFLARFG